MSGHQGGCPIRPWNESAKGLQDAPWGADRSSQSSHIEFGEAHTPTLTLNKGPSVSFPLWLGQPGITPHTLRVRPTQPAAPPPLDTLPRGSLSLSSPCWLASLSVDGSTPCSVLPSECFVSLYVLSPSNCHIPAGTTSCLLNYNTKSSSCLFIHLFHKYSLCQSLETGEQKQAWPLPSGS